MTEIAADTFLNWGRSSFGDAAGEDNASHWGIFFVTNIDMFLRNAVIYQIMDPQRLYTIQDLQTIIGDNS